MTDYELAQLDPTRVFQQPEDVLTRSDFTTAQKIEILNRWKYDAIELEIAEEENMGGGEREIRHAYSSV